MTDPGPADPLTAALRAAGCVFAEEEAAILREAAASADDLAHLLARRVAGEPLEQVVGWAGFAGLRLTVAPGVFVPRRRTELLAREAAALLPADGTAVDLCCGVGAVAAALRAANPRAQLYAVDVDPTATTCAATNLPDATVLTGDLDAPLPRELAGTVDVLVANAPYVPTGEIGLMPREAREHEAPTALDGGPDGLDLHRRIAALAPRWLRPGGHLLIETSTRQAAATLAAMESAGMSGRTVTDDHLGATVAVGRLDRQSVTGSSSTP